MIWRCLLLVFLIRIFFIFARFKTFNFSILVIHYSTFVLKKSIFSAVVLKHTISKRNKLLSWHKNLTRITSLITNVRNFDRNMISHIFLFSTLFIYIKLSDVGDERSYKCEMLALFFLHFVLIG